MTSTARHLCFSEHTTRLNPRASGAAVPQVPNRSSAPSVSSTPFSLAGRVSSLPCRLRRDDVAAVPVRPCVGVLQGRAEPDDLEPAQPLRCLVATHECARGVGAGLRDLLAHGARVDREEVSVDHQREPADLDRHRRVRTAARDRLARVDGVGGLAQGQLVAAADLGRGRRWRCRARCDLGALLGSGVRFLRRRRTAGEQSQYDDQERGCGALRTGHSSVFAQQTERRLPACQSPSWNQV